MDSGIPEIHLVPKGPDEADDLAFTFTPDRPFRMRYGIFVFDTPAAEPVDPQAIFRAFSAE